MLKKAKQSYHDSGIGPIMWGSVITFCSLITWARFKFGFDIPFDIWLLTLLAIIPQVFISIKENRAKKARTYNDIAINYTWLAFGVSIFLLIHANTGIGEADTPDHTNDDAGDETADVSSGCGDVTEAGSCNGNTLQFCENGELVSAPCGSGSTCGDDYPGSGYKVCSKGDTGSSEPVSDSSDLTDSGNDEGSGNAGNADAGNANGEPPADAGAGCGLVSEVGMCTNGQLSYCDNGSLKEVDCKAAGRSCGFDIGNLWFDCLLFAERPPPLAPPGGAAVT